MTTLRTLLSRRFKAGRVETASVPLAMGGEGAPGVTIAMVGPDRRAFMMVLGPTEALQLAQDLEFCGLNALGAGTDRAPAGEGN